MLKLSTISLLITALLFGCQDDAESTSVMTPPAKGYFISATPTSDISVETLKQFALTLGQPAVAGHLKYSVKSYTLVYQTTYQGKPVEASGILLVPIGVTEKAPIVSLQHGTTFSHDEAPSVSGGFTGTELFASAGYISLVPDFIGYGSSAEIFHPYYDKEHSAIAIIDMVKSVKEFLSKEKIPFSDELFLAGYSEGGYVTLAAAEKIENETTHSLKLSAVAAGAGGYDLSSMLSGVTKNTYYSYPAYLAFVLMSYNTTYKWNKPLTYFFKKQYADALQKYMNGEYGGGTINAQLTTNLEELFDTGFYARLRQPDGEMELKQALKNNSVEPWRTEVPIRLYHGTKDEIIPYVNSEITAKKFLDAGSTDVSLTLIPNGTHGSSFLPMMKLFVPWFLEQ
jgi:pimeloyl-ACP methyl ester carboxylesterase